MIKSILLPLIIVCASAYILLFELFLIGQDYAFLKLDTKLNSFFRESPFLTSTQRIEMLSSLTDTTTKTKEHIFDHKGNFKAGTLNLLKALDTNDADEKLNTICKAREQFKSALTLSPRKIEYQLSLADIESISPNVASTCDQFPDSKNLQSINVLERLNWIENLAPFDPPTLYKKGLIEKALGQNIAALTSFRKFDETSINSSEDHRNFFCAFAHSDKELQTLIPEKYPNTLNWLSSFKQNGNHNVNFNKIFEDKLIAMTDNMITENAEQPQEIIKNLFGIYWAKDIQNYSELRFKLAGLLFKYLSLNSNNQFAADYFRIISNSKRLPVNITTQFSNISKKTGKSYNWVHGTSEDELGIDLRSMGFGLYLDNHTIDSNKETSLLVISGNKGETFPDGLTPEIWISRDNINYSQTNILDSKFTKGTIDSIPTAYLEIGKLPQKYVKIYFNYSGDRAYRISGPAFKILQIYKKNYAQ